MTQPPRFRTVDEVAAELRVDPETVRRYARTGELKGTKLPGGWRFTEDAVEEFINGRDEPVRVAS